MKSDRFVLLVTYFYPPMTSVGGLRLRGWASHLLTMGVIPIVVTVGSGRTVAHEDGVNVIRTRDFRIRRPCVRQAGHPALATERRDGVRALLLHVVRRLRDELLVPDEQVGWLMEVGWAADQVLKIVGGGEVAAVIASSPPPTSLLVGRSLARRTGAPLIADYRDLWTNNPVVRRSRVRRKLDRLIESWVAKSFCAVMVAVSGLSRGMPWLDGRRAPIEVLTGVDLRCDIVAPPEGPFRILYAGQLYGGRRNPVDLVSACRLAAQRRPERDFELLFMGSDVTGITDEHVGSFANLMVSAVGEVGLEEARAAMDHAHVLVSIGLEDEEDSAAIPGKLFEYLASQRKILCMGPSNRRLSQMLYDLQAGVLAESALDGAEFIVTVSDEWAAGRYIASDPAALSNVSKESCARAVLEIIEHHEP